MTEQLPNAKNLYFHVSGVLETNAVLDFDTMMEELHYCGQVMDYLAKNHKQFNWYKEGECFQVSGTFDNYSPPKVNSFVSANITDLVETKSFSVSIDDERSVECEITNIQVHVFSFNCAIIFFEFHLPPEVWRDEAVLSRLRFFIQRHRHPEDEFPIDLESIFETSLASLKKAFLQTVNALDVPRLETPFLDFTTLSDGMETQLLWTHSTMVSILPREIDLSSRHYHGTLLDTSADGIQNYALLPHVFAYIESGDSLICIHDIPDSRNRSHVQVVFEDWIYWIGLQHYTWKVAWELDRGLYIMLNLVTAHLKHKRTGEYRDVYAVNALINHIKLLLDTHKPRNMTTAFYSVHFLEKINKEWRTTEMLEAADEKMESLQHLIGQLDEIESALRDERIEMFLTFVGVFALGSLVLDILGALSFSDQIPDLILLILAMGIPAIFLVVAYQLLRK